MDEDREWLLLRGWGRESRHWWEFPAELKQATRAQKVTCLDISGIGTQCQENTPLTLSK